MFTNERLFTIQAFTITRVHCTLFLVIRNWPYHIVDKLNKKLIAIIYLSIRTFAIWILPQVVASWSGVEYLGKSIWLTSSPRLSLSKTSSRFPAIAASFRFFDIFWVFFFKSFSVNLSRVSSFAAFTTTNQILLQLSVRPLIVFPELPWLLSLLVSLKLIQSVRRKLTHTFWNGRP